MNARTLCLALSLLVSTMTGCEFFLPLPPTFDVRESVEQLQVTGAEPGIRLIVVDKR
jgi:hypothetical protein